VHTSTAENARRRQESQSQTATAIIALVYTWRTCMSPNAVAMRSVVAASAPMDAAAI
jgi:hypothetical protein